SPSRSKTSVCPSGETSTDIHVPSSVSNEILRASARGALMSAATSGFLALSSLGSSAARAAGVRERARSVANAGIHLRIVASIFQRKKTRIVCGGTEGADYLPPPSRLQYASSWAGAGVRRQSDNAGADPGGPPRGGALPAAVPAPARAPAAASPDGGAAG